MIDLVKDVIPKCLLCGKKGSVEVIEVNGIQFNKCGLCGKTIKAERDWIGTERTKL
jgi:transcription elongation factor Elf1